MEMMLRAESNAVSKFAVNLVEETNTNTVFVNATNITTNPGFNRHDAQKRGDGQLAECYNSTAITF